MLEKTKTVEVTPVIRAMCDEDWAMITNSWKKGLIDDAFRDANGGRVKVPGIRKRNLSVSVNTLIDLILHRTSALVACDPDDYSLIYGFIVAEYLDGVPVVHWVYVRHALRRQGLARLLYAAVNPARHNALATFVTGIVEPKLDKYNLKFNQPNLEEILKHDAVSATGRLI